LTTQDRNEKLAKQFDGRPVLCGGIDVQRFLPKATPNDACETMGRVSDLVGRQSGCVRAGLHDIQVDTALEDILAMTQIIDEVET
jgi:hypothetical protein